MAQFIYGKNTVITRIEEKKDIIELYVTKETNQKNTALFKGIKTFVVSVSQLTKMINHPYHQGIVAKIEEYPHYDLDEVLLNLKEKENPLLLMLDGIVDPHNFGAILRSAEATGVDGVIVEKLNSAPLNSTVAKTSTGAIELVKVIKVSNLNNTLKKLKEKGFWSVSLETKETKDYRELDYKLPLVIIIGSEGKGTSPLLNKNSDFKVKIPMVGKINSLNASVATALILYQVYNNRFPL